MMKPVLLAAALLVTACHWPIEFPPTDPIPDAGQPLPPGEEYVPSLIVYPELEDALDPESAANMTPEDVHSWEQDVIFRHGGAADFDGDGFKESVGKLDETGRLGFEIDENEDGTPDSISDGWRTVSDSNFDGKPDAVTVRSIRPNNGTKVVSEVDTDFDGIFDERKTREMLAPFVERYLTEKRATPDGEYEVTEEFTHSPIWEERRASLGEEPDPLCPRLMSSRFPRDVAPPLYGTAGVVIPYGREHRCTQEQATKVNKALQCVQRKIRTCLGALNPELAATMRKLVEKGHRATADKDKDITVKAVISCGGVCDMGGITAPDYAVFPNGAILAAIELPTGILNEPDDMACESLFHELMHAALIATAGDHSNGTDLIYSCSRSCSGCPHASIGAGDDHKDCARCAVKDRKPSCGLRTEVTNIVVPDGNKASCFMQIGTRVLSAGCTAKKVFTNTCDDTRSDLVSSWCCDKCPDGYALGDGSQGWCDMLRNNPGDSCDDKKPPPLWTCKS